MSRLKLKYWQRHRLYQQLKATSDARTYRRTLAVLELNRGRSAAEIAAMLGVTRQSVHNRAAAFAREPDPAVLRDEDRSGRPPLLDEQAEGFPPSLTGQSPRDLGYPHADWTGPLLQQELERGPGLRPSDETRRCGAGFGGSVTSGSGHATFSIPTRIARKKTADSLADPGFAAAERRAGPGRDRPDDVSAVAGRLVAEGRTGRGPHQRLERPEGHLRGDEPPDRNAVDAAAAQGACR
jgi:transposase